jgi:DNA modification methylase
MKAKKVDRMAKKSAKETKSEASAINIFYRNIAEIKPNPKNPRVIRDEKFKKLVASLQEFPQMLEKRPLVCFTDTDGKFVVLGGNMRLRAAQELKLESLPIMLADDWTEEQKAEFLIKDNVGFGEWNWEELANEWDSEKLDAWGLDVPGFDGDEIEAEENDFDVPDGGIETDIVLGDLFEIGEHRLLCGDSTDSDAVAKLMNGKKADMVFTSPPYNGNTSVGFHQSSKKNSLPTSPLYNNNETDNKTSEEYIKFNSDIFNTIKTIASDDLVILYNINYNRNSPSEFIDVVNAGRHAFSLVETIIWEKSMAISLAGDNLTRIIEFIFVFYNGDDKPKLNKSHTNECIKNLWKVSNNGANHEIHKACFPIKLVEEGINVYGKQNALLYEPFTGSGTTMVASHQLKRKCYGMELDPKYCQVIIDRMRKLDPNIVIKKNGHAI